MSNFPGVGLTAISGGINRLRTKGGADKNSLFDLLNGYVTQAGTVKVREGTTRNANIATYSGVGTTKGLLAYQGDLHVFASQVVSVPPGYTLHVLNYPANQNVSANLTFVDGTFAATTRIGTNTNYGLVSASSGFAKAAIINPVPGSDVGSVTPTTFLDVTVAGFFQATAASPSDPNEVYLVTNPALPTTATLTYTGPSGAVTVTAGNVLTTNLGLAAGYAAYALGTGTPAADPNFADVSLLLHCDGANGSISFPDVSNNANAITVHGAAAVSTSQKEFGTGSFAGNNSTASLSSPIALNNGLDIVTGDIDFTLEFWVYVNSAAAFEGFIDLTGVISGNGYRISLSDVTAGHVTATRYGGVGGTAAITHQTAMTASAWHHVALVRQGANFHLYLDGVQDATGISTLSNNGALATGVAYIGQVVNSTGFLNGFMDEIRITKGLARYTAGFTPPTQPFLGSLTLTYNNSAPFPLKEIHFSAPYLGGIYVVAEFNVTDSTLLAEFGSVFHYWIQSSVGGDNSNEWSANTDYQIGDVVIPTAPNGLTYIASRLLPSNPLWTANTLETVGNIVEPTTPNGFKFTATATLGATPTTGGTEPTWPTTDGATVLENSSLENDQTITLASAAPAAVAPSTPARYSGLFTPPDTAT